MSRRILITAAAVALTCTFGLAANTLRTDAPGARFAEWDRNGDGGLDRGEAAVTPRFAERFDRIDRNRDGRLVPLELREAMRLAEARRELAKAQRAALRAQFAFLDSDGDRTLTPAEIGNDAPRLAEKFGLIDANRDGRVAAEELHSHLKAERDARRAERAG